MKWCKYFIVNLNSGDKAACQHTTAWKQRYLIPYHRCFGLGMPSGADCIPLYPLSSTSFASVDRFSKLIIVSHANDCWINSWTPLELAERLKAWGLKEVGLMSFKACFVGQGNYLDELGGCLSGLGIRFGWLIAYRGSVELIGYSFSDTHEVINAEDRFWRAFGWKMPDSIRIRLVRGNIPVVNPLSHRFMQSL
jgi:hypothetical protein